jgi:hypothetical protein
MDYDIDFDKVRPEENPITLDNMKLIADSLAKIQEILDDINKRLEEGSL